MPYSNNILIYIQGEESYVPYIKADTGGVLTGGYGHTGADVNALGAGAPVSTELAISWLNADAKKANDTVNRLATAAGISLNQNQEDALTDFEFNTGALSENETLWGLIVGGSSESDITSWWENHYITDKAGNRLPGLVTRRQYEASLYFTPVSFLKKKS